MSGIGPRLALATLAVLEPDALRAALADGNITALTQVPGIGRKGAERLVIELRDKVGLLPGPAAHADWRAAAGCGPPWSRRCSGSASPAKQAEQTVDAVLAENGVSRHRRRAAEGPDDARSQAVTNGHEDEDAAQDDDAAPDDDALSPEAKPSENDVEATLRPHRT